jgi:hypothetical protein
MRPTCTCSTIFIAQSRLNKLAAQIVWHSIVATREAFSHVEFARNALTSQFSRSILSARMIASTAALAAAESPPAYLRISPDGK